MLTDENCTLYLKNGNGFDRYFVPHCHWQESKASNVIKSGLQTADGIVVYIFASDISSELKAALSGHKCTAQDIVIRGECLFTFDASTQQSASQSLRTLSEQEDVHTVMSIDSLLYGSEGMQHFKLSAR